jgi:Na+-driven multidrug efflux pump
MGRLGQEGVLAGLSAANALNGLSYAVITGASGALSIIIGKTVGEGKKEEVRDYSKAAQTLFFALGLLCCATILALSHPFLSLYGTSALAKGHAVKFIKVIAFLSIATSYQSACLVGIIKSGGDSRFPFLCDLFLVIFAVLPISLGAMRLSLPPWTVLLALKLDQPLKCIIGGIKVRKFDWMKNLAKSEFSGNKRG